MTVAKPLNTAKVRKLKPGHPWSVIIKKDVSEARRLQRLRQEGKPKG